MSKKGFGKTISEFDFVALKKGKHVGFIAAYNLYAEHIFSLCIHLVKYEEVSTDIMQSVFEILLKKSSAIKARETLGAWLKQCTINECMKYFRGNMQHNVFLDNFFHEEEFIDLDCLHDKTDNFVTANLMRLSMISRNVLYLHAVQNLKHSEIAKNLSIKESNSRKLYSRAINEMKVWMTKRNKQ